MTPRETAARALAELGPDEDWPTNEALGGNPTGTRDDEYRAAMLDDAAHVLAAVAAHDGLADVLARALADAQNVPFVGPRQRRIAAHLADVVRAWMVS